MRTLVTGGSGFIGSHLVDQLLGRGDHVVVIDNYLTGRRVNLLHQEANERLTIVEQDVVESLTSAPFLQPFDRIIHLASPASPVGYAKYPIQTQLVNAFGTRNVLDLAHRDGARIVYSSTSEIYGDPLVHPQNESYWGNVNPVGPRACYDESKRFAESLITEYHRQHGVDTRIARIFNTYGPRSDPQDGRVVPNFCMQALQGEPISIYGNGLQTRSFCFVSDTVNGLLALADTDGIGGEVINIGNPAEITIADFARTVVRIARSNSKILFKPLPVDDPTRRKPDISKAHRLLGWEPRIDLEDGLTRTIAYFAEYHSVALAH
jgi:nucleoside-diphosphate-sugar epimerase